MFWVIVFLYVIGITFKRFVNIPRASLLSQVLGFFELLISVVWSDLCQERTLAPPTQSRKPERGGNSCCYSTSFEFLGSLLVA